MGKARYIKLLRLALIIYNAFYVIWLAHWERARVDYIITFMSNDYQIKKL